MAPELLGIEPSTDNSRTPTSQSDLFALGMVAIEVITSVLSVTWSFLNDLTHLGVYRASAVPRKQRLCGDEEDRGR